MMSPVRLNIKLLCLLIYWSLDIRLTVHGQSFGTFNVMNCMDFARHMTGTAQRFGLISTGAAAGAAGAAAARRRRIDRHFVQAVMPVHLLNRILPPGHQIRQEPVGGAAAGAAAAAAAGAGGAVAAGGAGGLVDTFQSFFSQVLNIGDSNVAACQQRPRLLACENVDSYMNQVFPEWWFNLRVTDNANYVASQFLAGNRYHALLESGMKAYKCFCQC